SRRRGESTTMNSELKQLQGTWNVVTLEIEGRPMPSVGAQIVVKGERFKSLGMGDIYEGKLVVDGKTLDMKFTAGPEKGNTNHGIFEMTDDGWRLCLQMAGKDRPKQFATKPGTGLALETFERAKPAAKTKTPRTVAPSGDPVPELGGE